MPDIPMTAQEKILYHQIHPLKLATDIAVAIPSLYALWRRRLGLALVSTLPSLVVSLALMRFANLEPYRQSRLGRYIGRYMTGPLEATRGAGFVLMALGAWYHVIWLLPLGLLVTVLAWLRGVIWPRR